MPDYPPLLMRQDEAARFFGVSPSMLRSLRIPRRVVGTMKVYHRAEIEAWAAALPHEGAAAKGDADSVDWG